MDFSGEYRVPAPRQTVWEALNDPEILKQCIAGCESLDRITDTELTAKLKVKIGPVSAKFAGTVTLSDMTPPERYVISGQGQGGAAGFFKGSATVTLTEDGPDATVMRYESQATVGGKLASVGGRLVKGVANKTADDFFHTFSDVVGGAQPVTPEEGPATDDVAPLPSIPPTMPPSIPPTMPAPASATTADTPLPSAAGPQSARDTAALPLAGVPPLTIPPPVRIPLTVRTFAVVGGWTTLVIALIVSLLLFLN